jgi:hypothetical protein
VSSFDTFNPQEMWKPDYYGTLKTFIEQESSMKLFFWIEEETNLCVKTTGPPSFYSEGGSVNPADYQVVYFLKKVFDKPITYENIEQCIRVGVIEGDPLGDILTKMNTELPKLLGEKKWPDGVKEEFVAQLHKFMSALTEASHAS